MLLQVDLKKKRKLPKDKIVPLISNRLFKKVFVDMNHKERLEKILSLILKEKILIIDIKGGI